MIFNYEKTTLCHHGVVFLCRKGAFRILRNGPLGLEKKGYIGDIFTHVLIMGRPFIGRGPLHVGIHEQLHLVEDVLYRVF